MQVDEPGPSAPYKSYATLKAHGRSVTALRFSHDGRTLVSAGADGYLHFWDTASGSHKRSIRCHRTGINDISLSPDGLYVSTASDDGTSLVFPTDPLLDTGVADGPTGSKPLRTLAGHTAPVLSVAYSPRANLTVTGSFDESAIVWDVRRGKALRTLPAHSEAVWTVGWDAEGALVLTGSADGLIRLWDANTGQCLKTLDNESNSPVSSAAFTPSSFFILSSSLSSTVRVHSLHSGKVLKTLRAPEYVSERFPCPSLVFAGLEPTTNGHATADAMEVDTPPPRRNRATWVIAGSENGKVILWDLQDRRVIGILDGHTAPVVAVAVHPDSRSIATGALDPDRSVKIWRA